MTDYTGDQPPAYNPAPYNGDGPAATGVDPGRTMGIVGLILGIVGFFVFFLAPIAGIIVSVIARNKSKAAGFKNGIAKAGLIVSIIALVANIIVTIALVSIGAALGGAAVDLLEQCQNDPSGVVEFQGQEIPCSQLLEDSGN